eukprot:scaffold107676_cov31-Tisochrysis_lutea.AAC.2
MHSRPHTGAPPPGRDRSCVSGRRERELHRALTSLCACPPARDWVRGVGVREDGVGGRGGTGARGV